MPQLADTQQTGGDYTAEFFIMSLTCNPAVILRVCVCARACVQGQVLDQQPSFSSGACHAVSPCVCVCRVELDQQAAEVERQRRQLTGAARTQAQLSQLETELARREQDLKVAYVS